MTTIQVTNNLELGIDVKIRIPQEELFWLTPTQVQMFHILDNKPIIEQLRILLILLLEINSRGGSHGENQIK